MSWLIAISTAGVPNYWNALNGFTLDADEALRFERKEDAEKLLVFLWERKEAGHVNRDVYVKEVELTPDKVVSSVAMHHETVVELAVDNADLGITFETITGTWTPGQHDDWADYNQRVGIRVFDQACKAVEALSYQRNLILPIAMVPDAARTLFDEDGSSLRRQKAGTP